MSRRDELESNEEFQRLVREDGKNIVILEDGVHVYGPNPKYMYFPLIDTYRTIDDLLDAISSTDLYDYLDPLVVKILSTGTYCLCVLIGSNKEPDS